MDLHGPSSIQNSSELQRRVQSIEEQLKLQRMSPATREQLFCELEGTHQSLQALQEKAETVGRVAQGTIAKNSCEFAQAQVLSDLEELDALKEKIITLYGAIYSRSLDDEVEEIKLETQDLQRSLTSGDLEEICKNVAILSRHINYFCGQHRPSREKKQIIALARHSLKQADTLFFTKVLGSTLNQFNVIALHEAAADIEDNEPEVMELFETADLFYRRKFKDALSQFNRLSPSLKKRTLSHLEKIEGNPADLCTDIYKTIAALIATAHEISHSEDGEGYIQKAEIDQMFREITQLNF
jgi:hypothetical protein